MGVLYSVFPIDGESRAWLRGEGIACPDADGRAPTPNEIAAALDALDGFTINYNISEGVWQAQVDDASDPENGMWTLVNVMKPNGLDVPCDFYFSKGWPQLIARILHSLAPIAGPFALVPDTGCPALVIDKSTDLQASLDSWGHLTGG